MELMATPPNIVGHSLQHQLRNTPLVRLKKLLMFDHSSTLISLYTFHLITNISLMFSYSPLFTTMEKVLGDPPLTILPIKGYNRFLIFPPFDSHGIYILHIRYHSLPWEMATSLNLLLNILVYPN